MLLWCVISVLMIWSLVNSYNISDYIHLSSVPIVSRQSRSTLDMIRSCRNHHFSDNCLNVRNNTILIILNFHEVYYYNIPWMIDHYYPLFCALYSHDFDLLIVGIEENKELKVINNDLPSRGWYSYHSVNSSVEYVGWERMNKYEGFMFMNDDSFVDPLNVNRYQLDVAFHEPQYPYPDNHYWGHWYRTDRYKDWIVNHTLKAFEEINSTPLVSQCGEWKWYHNDHGWSDFFYVPHSLFSFFLATERVLFRNHVYLESAIYHLMNCITNVTVSNCNHVRCRIDGYDYDHIHPLKYSKESNRLIALSIMERKLNSGEKYYYNKNSVTVG